MKAQKRILLIDDDPDNRDLIRFVLKKAGYEVLETYNGVIGIELAHKEMPDMVLLDLAMPEMDGWEVARRLKTDPDTKQIKIVALTVRTLAEDRRQAIEAGVDGYLTKPISVNTFIDDVGRFLDEP